MCVGVMLAVDYSKWFYSYNIRYMYINGSLAKSTKSLCGHIAPYIMCPASDYYTIQVGNTIVKNKDIRGENVILSLIDLIFPESFLLA